MALTKQEAEDILAGRPPSPRPTKVATFEDWKHAVAIAHAYCCRGDLGHGWRDGEAWVETLNRTAGTLLADHGFGRAPGECPDEWANFVIEVARKPSTSSDGMVAWQGRDLRIPRSHIPTGC